MSLQNLPTDSCHQRYIIINMQVLAVIHIEIMRTDKNVDVITYFKNIYKRL